MFIPDYVLHRATRHDHALGDLYSRRIEPTTDDEDT